MGGMPKWGAVDLGLKIKSIRLPILKVWDSRQLNIGEVLVTLPAGSMLHDGGLNVKHLGGAREERDKVKFEEAKKQIFEMTEWTKTNLEGSSSQLQLRREYIQSYSAYAEGATISNKISGLKERVSTSRTTALQTTSEIANATKRIDQLTRSTSEYTKELEGTTGEHKRYPKFHSVVKQWLEKTP